MALGFWAKDYLGPKEAGGSGGGGGVLVVPVVTDYSVGKSTLQRSYRNLKIDFESGRIVFAKLATGKEIRLVSFVGELSGKKTVWITPNNANTSLIVATANQETDYPSWDDE